MPTQAELQALIQGSKVISAGRLIMPPRRMSSRVFTDVITMT